MNETDVSLDSDLLVVQEAARVITRAADPKPAIYAILRILSQLLGLNRGRVLLPCAQSEDVLKVEYAYGLTQEEIERGSYAIGEGVTGKVYKTGQIGLIQNIDEEPLYVGRTVYRSTLPDESVSFIAVPIINEDKPVGVLGVHRLRNRQREFRRDVALLQVLSIFIGQALHVRALINEQTEKLSSENRLLKNKLQGQGARYGIIGQSPVLLAAIQQALQVAYTATTVLLLGESGTGKERFARMQHLASPRADGPFISINCAAIPETLLESELFGHEKGAFTGASAMKRGKLELASNGTLFLDEIGDLDVDLQGKLLKVLEEKVVQRVGGNKDIPVDVRIVAATHKNLQNAVRANRFRLDLFYRLNVFPIRLPPLRSRNGDIPLLAQFFLDAANIEYGRDAGFATGVFDLLQAYQWPGNIRQLENLVKRAVLMSSTGTISSTLIKKILDDEKGLAIAPQAPGSYEPDKDPEADVANISAPPQFANGVRPYARVREDEADSLLDALRCHQGNKTRAALSLGMTPRQFRYRLQKLKL